MHQGTPLVLLVLFLNTNPFEALRIDDLETRSGRTNVGKAVKNRLTVPPRSGSPRGNFDHLVASGYPLNEPIRPYPNSQLESSQSSKTGGVANRVWNFGRGLFKRVVPSKTDTNPNSTTKTPIDLWLDAPTSSPTGQFTSYNEFAEEKDLDQSQDEPFKLDFRNIDEESYQPLPYNVESWGNISSSSSTSNKVKESSPSKLSLGYGLTLQAYYTRHYLTVLGLLGTGSISEIYQIQDGITQQLYIMKRSPKAGSKRPLQLTSSGLPVEAYLLASMPHHRNVARGAGFIETKDHYNVFLEYLPGGNLYDYIRTRQPTDDPIRVSELLRWTRHLFSGLKAISEAGFVHGDIRPGNLRFRFRRKPNLVTEEPTLVIIDFGAAFPIGETGSFYYGAEHICPELIDAYRGAGFNEGRDLWAAAVTMAELSTGKINYPTMPDDHQHLTHETLKKNYPPIQLTQQDLLDNKVVIDNEEDFNMLAGFLATATIYDNQQRIAEVNKYQSQVEQILTDRKVNDQKITRRARNILTRENR